jgi:hypothetical protein
MAGRRANAGGARISARKKPFALNYTDNDGKRRQESFHSMKAAHLRRREVEQEIDLGLHTARRETVTLGEALEAWLDDCERRGLTGTTRGGYRGSIDRHLMPALGKVKLCDLTSQRCQDLVDDVSSRFKRAHIRTYLVLTLRFAVKRKWLRSNPSLAIRSRSPKAVSVARRPLRARSYMIWSTDW